MQNACKMHTFRASARIGDSGLQSRISDSNPGSSIANPGSPIAIQDLRLRSSAGRGRQKACKCMQNAYISSIGANRGFWIAIEDLGFESGILDCESRISDCNPGSSIALQRRPGPPKGMQNACNMHTFRASARIVDSGLQSRISDSNLGSSIANPGSPIAIHDLRLRSRAQDPLTNHS